MGTLAGATGRMVEEFTKGIRDLETLSMLLGDANRSEILVKFSQELCHTEMLLEELDRQIKQDLELLPKARLVCQRLQESKTRARHLERSLPNNHATGNEEEDEDSTIVVLSKAALADTYVDQISLPSSQQFEQGLPRYKKTITLEQLEKICAFVNEAAGEKKRLLFSPTNKQDFAATRKLQEWKLQSTPELAKLMFVTEEDVLGVMDAKTTAVELRAGLECLRHLGVLRVSSTAEGVKRYVFLK
ncbi:hypothetical protein BASA81_006390 [Batrachochytrium salamandrivorans]|nr:hypothetical protein BASA81_006390 [Batrachochytrium salamandrivorans]